MTENILNTPAGRFVLEHSLAYEAEHGHKPGVYIKTFGCQQNEADSERLAGMAVVSFSIPAP